MSRIKSTFRIIPFVTLLCLLSACASDYVAPFTEIEGYKIEEIAFPRITRFDGGGIVVYNAEACKQIGAGCGFFKLHAYAHLWLRHTIVKPGNYTSYHEDAADCWAAGNGKPEEIKAVVEFLMEPARHEGLLLRGDPATRARLIKQCAMDAGKWSQA